MEIQAV